MQKESDGMIEAVRASHQHLLVKTRSASPQAKLDLHGKTQDEAKALLRVFLNRAKTNHVAVALIVFGKGLHSKHGGVLRDLTYDFLSCHPDVLAFVTPPRHLGGTGAILVRL